MRVLSYLATLAVASAILVAAILTYRSFDPLQREARAQALHMEQQRAALLLDAERFNLQQAQAQAAVVAPAASLAAVLWTLAPLAIFGLALYLAVDAYKLRRMPLVKPDARGLLPVARVQIEQGQLVDAFTAALAEYHRTQAVRAAQPVIDKFSYNLTVKEPGAITGPQGEADVLALPLPVQVPTFRDMLSRGMIQHGGPLVLGFTDGAPLEGSWKDLYSSAVAGVQGSGKSVTMRYLACQSALHGARFVVVDPHMETSPEDSLAQSLMPLERAMLCAPAADAPAILDSVRLMTSHLDQRMKGDSDRTPIIFIVDEFTQTMRTPNVATELAMLLERLATEGRKVQLFACLGGQTWGVERSGGSPLRNALASAYVHRIKRPEAMKLLQLGADTPQTHDLPTGGAWLYRTSGELVRVQVPLTTADDVQHVADLLYPSTSSQRVIDVQPEAGAEVALEVGTEAAQALPLPQHSNALDARSERVRQLLRSKAAHRDIVREVWGIESTGGRAYQEATQELRDILAELV